MVRKIWGFKALSLLGFDNIGPFKYSYDKVWSEIIRNAKARKEENQCKLQVTYTTDYVYISSQYH